MVRPRTCCRRQCEGKVIMKNVKYLMTAKGVESIEKKMIKSYNVSICVVERKEKAYKSRPIPLVGANFVFTKEEGKKEKNGC